MEAMWTQVTMMICGLVRIVEEVRLKDKVHALVQWRIPRNPIIGDKFASRHGQKGINSFLWPAESMPFSETGVVPDILFNPHGFPSRMTIGMMVESMAGKVASVHGREQGASPFVFSEENTAIDHFGKLLSDAGFDYLGSETLYSGVDGRELEVQVFFGVVYYQRLRHMIDDKFQVRSTGPVDPVTLQPVKGRKKHGGIRFGEMERDALISHGANFCLQDRLFNCSDSDTVFVCAKCQSIVSVSKLKSSMAMLRRVDTEQRRMLLREKDYHNYTRLHCTVCKSDQEVYMSKVPRILRYLCADYNAFPEQVKNKRRERNEGMMLCDDVLLHGREIQMPEGTVEQLFQKFVNRGYLTSKSDQEVYMSKVPRILRYLCAELSSVNVRLQLVVVHPYGVKR